MRPASSTLDGGCLPRGWRGDVRSLPGRLFGGLALLVPVEVLACPSCTARAPESPGGAGGLLLALMLVPFVLVGVGIWAARRVMREERASAPVEQEHP
ncbi:hypothetical protein D7Y13_39880 [Corallococcus praedator]|uniref:Uncharacterized protein n=1 Tax=Corallococcus praedator TaxID=2316724 RepID=A0ABX9Q6I8_9BACT|nr:MULTISPECIES: hypothetical protein [Corallococcus]RKH17395.1 hypothetical protein D7X75_40320 [Corallococcus sp. CA031C]RKH90409.1 hypothetical protein D7Y13_39880 [Corallococcus praedator]